jgi:LysR family transcriptional regulator of abg operon
MTLQQLQDLMAVLAHGGFRSAARALSVSQAGLTKSVARLEEECGFALLARTAKGVALTAEGDAFLPFAQAVIGECDRAQQWLLDVGKRPVRHVALGVSIEPSLSLAPSVLADFRRSMPEVTVHVSQSSPSELLARLRDNTLEIAVMRLPGRDLLDDMRVEVLYDAPAAIVARRQHPLAGVQSVRELVQAQWVVVGDPARPSSDDASIRELFIEQRIGKPRIAAVCDSLFGAVSMLMESDCVARLPRAVLEHPLASGVLAELPVREQAVHEIGLVRRSGRRLGREAQMLASMLKSFARVRAGLSATTWRTTP